MYRVHVLSNLSWGDHWINPGDSNSADALHTPKGIGAREQRRCCKKLVDLHPEKLSV